jgi:hypothetical protein
VTRCILEGKYKNNPNLDPGQNFKLLPVAHPFFVQ